MAFADIAAKLIPGSEGVIGFGVEFSLTDGVDTVTLKISDNPKFGPTWQPAMVSCSDLSHEIRRGEGIVRISDFRWEMMNDVMQYAQDTVSHTRMDQLFGNGFTWHGQNVTVYLLALDEVTGVVEEHAIWPGRIVDCPYNELSITFEAESLCSWNLSQTIPTSSIALSAYPEAPESSRGMPIPMVFGDFTGTYKADELDSWNIIAERAGIKQAVEGQRYAIPCVCVDENKDGTAPGGPRFLIADHRLYGLPDPDSVNKHVYVRIPGYDQLGVVAPADEGGCTTTIDDAYADVWFDEQAVFSMYFYGYEVDDQDTSTNPENAIDPDYETYATLADDDVLKFRIERPPDFGLLTQCQIRALVSTVDWESGMKIRLGLYRDEDDDSESGGDGWWPGTISGYTDFTKTVGPDDTLEWRTHYFSPGSPPDMIPQLKHTNDFPDNMRLRLSLTDAGSATLKVHALVLIIWYAASAWGVRADATGGQIPHYPRPRYRPPTTGNPTLSDAYPEITDGEKRVFVTCQGRKDDAFGTYTGTANSLIKSACDIVHRLIDASGNTPNTAYTPGDLTVTRSYHAAYYIRHHLRIDRHTTYADVISEICRQSNCSLLCRFSAAAELGMLYWDGDGFDYDYATDIPWDHVLHEREFYVGHTHARDVRNALYFQLNYNHLLGKEDQLVYADKDGSDDGTGTDDYSHCASLGESEDGVGTKPGYGRREYHGRFRYAFERNGQAARTWHSEFTKVAADHCEVLRQPRVIMRFSLPWKYYDLQVGHFAEPASDWQDHIHYPGEAAGSAGQWNHAGALRYFVITRISFSPEGYMELETEEQRIVTVNENW